MFGPEVGVADPRGMSGLTSRRSPKIWTRTISRSKVTEFTINDLFEEKLGNSPPLSPPLVVLLLAKNVTAAAKPIGTLQNLQVSNFFSDFRASVRLEVGVTQKIAAIPQAI